MIQIHGIRPEVAEILRNFHRNPIRKTPNSTKMQDAPWEIRNKSCRVRTFRNQLQYSARLHSRCRYHHSVSQQENVGVAGKQNRNSLKLLSSELTRQNLVPVIEIQMTRASYNSAGRHGIKTMFF